MRAIILSSCALALAACGAAGAQDAPDLSGLPEAYQEANLSKGRTQWFLCAACHQINNGSSHSVGPDLFEIFGKTAGANTTFPIYSAGLKESGIVWTPETLDTWLANPRTVVSGTTMIFPGIAKPEDRRDLIAYLWTEAGGAAE
jgi:cytochrome c